jgi:hypothetical protein
MAAYAHYVAHIIIKGKDLIKGLVVFDNYLHTQIKRWGGVILRHCEREET